MRNAVLGKTLEQVQTTSL